MEAGQGAEPPATEPDQELRPGQESAQASVQLEKNTHTHTRTLVMLTSDTFNSLIV